MNRERWKWFLGAVCLLMIAGVFYLSARLLEKIRKEEETKIKIWAGAIQKKSELLRKTQQLFEEIAEEERRKATLYARATEELAKASTPNGLDFLLFLLQNNRTVPVILTDASGKVVAHRNLDSVLLTDSVRWKAELSEMKKKYPPIRLNIFKGIHQWLYYKDSRILTQSKSIMDTLVQSYLQDVAKNSVQVEVLWLDEHRHIIAYYSPDNQSKQDTININKILQRIGSDNLPVSVVLPDGRNSKIYYAASSIQQYIQYFPYLFSLIFVLILIVTVFFYSTSYRLEQDRLWVGMSKETAHQLGTPISSLMGWTELLEEKHADARIVASMKEDLRRLKMITQRFSKIGSKPELKPEDLNALILHFVEYMKQRLSKNIHLETRLPEGTIMVSISSDLMEWVLENLVKNAADAMHGSGRIVISAEVNPEGVKVRVEDEGRGIPKGIRKKIFTPGFSTKSRGWGLGLSLSKRIVEEYHHGRIYLERSEPGKGSTFCMELAL